VKVRFEFYWRKLKIKFKIVLRLHTLNIIQQKWKHVLIQFSYWVEGETCHFCDLYSNTVQSISICARRSRVLRIIRRNYWGGVLVHLSLRIDRCTYFFLSAGNSCNRLPFELLSKSQSASISVRSVVPSKTARHEKPLRLWHDLFLCNNNSVKLSLYLGGVCFEYRTGQRLSRRQVPRGSPLSFQVTDGRIYLD
jgi:hypothetical protein